MIRSRHACLLTAGIATSVFCIGAAAGDAPTAADKTKQTSPVASMTDAQIIASASAAAPAKVSAGATIAVMNPDGTMRVVRQGKNGFTCIPDEPGTPGPDPMCLDKQAMNWVHALMGHTTLGPGNVGFMYMLAGGTDASNTDPAATKPLPNNHWIKTGPHVMVVGADPGFYDQYPKDADPDTSVPYVMWAGTPYQHLMIPVK